MTLGEKCSDTLNRVAKWRRVLTGRMLGTRPENDPECVGMNNLHEAQIMLRIEVSALTNLLLDQKVISQDQFLESLLREAMELDKAYEEKFPGFSAHPEGMHLELPEAAETMRSMNWPA